jgi:hypothetical protein
LPDHARALEDPKADKDGSPAMCVDTNPTNSAAVMGPDLWKFNAAGTYPATADGFCWH